MDGLSGEGRWLSYAELAELRGISKASATRMSFRHKWRRQAGNDGQVRIFVPESALRDKSNGSDMDGVAAAIEAVTVAFREQIEAERGRADRAESARDALRERLDATKDELRQAREATDQARQHAREAEDQIEVLRR
jgi:hypothetical protein